MERVESKRLSRMGKQHSLLKVWPPPMLLKALVVLCLMLIQLVIKDAILLVIFYTLEAVVASIIFASMIDVNVSLGRAAGMMMLMLALLFIPQVSMSCMLLARTSQYIIVGAIINTLALFSGLILLSKTVGEAHRGPLVALSITDPLPRLSTWLVKRLNVIEEARKAGRPLTLFEASVTTARGLALITIVLHIATPLTLCIGYKYTLTLLLLIATSPLTLKAYYKVMAARRAQLSEEELPFIALWAWILERAGVGSLEDAIRYAYSSHLLPTLALDRFFSPEELSRTHPSRRLRRFYSYYITIRSMGGNTARYLEDLVSREIGEVKNRLEAYAEKALSIGTGFLGIIAVLGLLSLLASFMGSIGMPIIAMALTVVLTSAALIFLSSVQPRLIEKYEWRRMAIAVSLSILLTWSIISMLNVLLDYNVSLVYEVIAVLLSVSATVTLWFRRLYSRRIREEEELLGLLRLAVEHVRTTPERPLQEVLREEGERPGSSLSEVLRTISLPPLLWRTNSWITKYALYTLTELMARKGATDPIALERIYDMVHAYLSTRKNISTRLKLLAGLTLGFPPLIVIASSLLARIVAGMPAMPLLMLTIPDQQTLLALALVTAVSMGTITAKTVSMTVKDMSYTLLSLLSLLGSLALTRLLPLLGS